MLIARLRQCREYTDSSGLGLFITLYLSDFICRPTRLQLYYIAIFLLVL